MVAVAGLTFAETGGILRAKDATETFASNENKIT
jgi:hypothetical protein